MCKNCGRQFIADHELTYKGCHSTINQRIVKIRYLPSLPAFLQVRGKGREVKNHQGKKCKELVINNLTEQASHCDAIEF